MTSPAIGPEELKRRIEAALPGASVRVGTFRGDDHFEAHVEAPQFAGKPLVEQHRMVYAALEPLLGGAVHALALRTRPRPPAGDTEETGR
jgi:stress-induced morphogen